MSKTKCLEIRHFLTLEHETEGVVMMKTLVLASTSPYRAGLLKRLDLPFKQFNPAVDEAPLAEENGEDLVRRLSHAKALAASPAFPDSVIIGSDQVGLLDGRILNKPGSQDLAHAQLRAASGREVTFLTGLCVLDSATGESLISVDVCRVSFRELSESQIKDYIARENPVDCAGSFKVEGLGIALFRSVSMEDPTTLEGLPLIRLTSALQRFGLAVIGAGEVATRAAL